MHHALRRGLAPLLALSLAAGPSVSAAGDAAPAPAKKANGSVFVRCDGQPAHMSGGELVFDLLAITATGGIVGGLVGGPEMADNSKKLKADEAVQACDAAIQSESNPTRRTQLSLARAIHLVEAERLEDALAAAKAAPEQMGDKGSDIGFRHSLGLSVLELQAAILLKMGRPADAEAMALTMVQASPWDVVNYVRASRYVGLTAEMTPAKIAYYERFQRLMPQSLGRRSVARQWSGDWLGSAHDLEKLVAAYNAFAKPGKEEPEPPILTARRSVAYLLGGDMAQSNELAANARAGADKMVASGEALGDGAAAASQTEELLDFQAIGRLLAEGQAKQARARFAARGRWLAPTPAAVALLTEKLRAGAAPEELTGALARDPSALRAEALAAQAQALRDANDKEGALFAVILAPHTAGDYAALSKLVWKGDKSPLIARKKPKDDYVGEMLWGYSQAYYGTVLGEAMLLNCAIEAKARGAAGCQLAPTRKKLYATFAILGSPGDKGIDPDLLLNADEVIAGLSPAMPRPTVKTPGNAY